MTIQENIAQLIEDFAPEATRSLELSLQGVSFSEYDAPNPPYSVAHNLSKTTIASNFLGYPPITEEAQRFDLFLGLNAFDLAYDALSDKMQLENKIRSLLKANAKFILVVESGWYDPADPKLTATLLDSSLVDNGKQYLVYENS